MTEQETTYKPRVGDFIAVTAWNDFGMIMNIEEPGLFGYQYDITIQQHPDQDADDWQLYRLNDEQFVFEGD